MRGRTALQETHGRTVLSLHRRGQQSRGGMSAQGRARRDERGGTSAVGRAR